MLEAIDAIEDEGRGVVVYLPPQGDLKRELEQVSRRLRSSPVAAPPPGERAHGGTLREYGLGAQVLRPGVLRFQAEVRDGTQIAVAAGRT